jgi:hypothetical protein
MVDTNVNPHPTNKIVVAGQPLLQVMEVETGTNMYAGRLVKKGTGDHDAVVVTAGTDDILGWLGYEHTHKKYRPEYLTTIYTAADQAVILNGGHFRIMAKLLSGQTIIKGEKLTGAAAGCVTSLTIGGTSEIVGTAEESITAACAGTGCDGTADIIVLSTI